MSLNLSVVIITRNEERDLPACLASLRGLDAEIVVLDNHSTDSTREIAGKAGAVVRERTFDDFASQKQAATDLARRAWVLSLDADERLRPDLREEIKDLLTRDGGPDGYLIPFHVHFLGKRLRFGGLGGETHLRLFRKAKGRFVGGKLHEGVRVDGPLGRTRGAIEHHTYRDLNEYFEKFSVYTANAAVKRFEAGKRFSPLHHLLPFWELFGRLVLRAGLLDGGPGVVWAGLSAFHTWVKYLKLRELETRG